MMLFGCTIDTYFALFNFLYVQPLFPNNSRPIFFSQIDLVLYDSQCMQQHFYDPNEYLWIDPSRYILPFHVNEWHFGQILSKIFVLSYACLVKTVRFEKGGRNWYLLLKCLT